MYWAGVDIGGTKIAASIAADDAVILGTVRRATPPGADFSPVFEAAAAMVGELLAARGATLKELSGIGISCPGPLDLAAGSIVQVATTGWREVPVRRLFEERFGVPVRLENDANAAAYAEARAGAGRGCGTVVYLTVSTGIGGGIVVDGKILYGAHGAGGEISHIPMRKDETDVCGCGKRGCAEQYGSANGVLRLAHRRMEHSSLPSPLRNMESITCKDIFDLSAQGDTLALEIREEYFDFLGQFLANVCCVVDPEAVILGGGVSKAGQPLLDGVRKYFLSYMFHTGREIVFALAKLGNDAGIYGGFQMARDGFGR